MLKYFKCDFNKATWHGSFIEITLQHGCSPVNLLHIYKNIFSLERFWRAAFVYKQPLGVLLENRCSVCRLN